LLPVIGSKQNHTSTYELRNIAAKSKPGVLVLYHIIFWSATDADLLNEISDYLSFIYLNCRDVACQRSRFRGATYLLIGRTRYYNGKRS
jgi:hypothetical protein